MRGGILQVLLVSAEGIKRTKSIGKDTYHVIIECGTQVHKSKTSAGNLEEICWNEKFTFEFPLSEWENLTKLKFKIVDEDYFTDGDVVGETIVYLEGIITEENAKGFIELKPAVYNVVLEDDTYQGQIKVGLKFMHSEIEHTETVVIAEERELGQSICGKIMSLWKLSRWKFLFCYSNADSNDKQKDS